MGSITGQPEFIGGAPKFPDLAGLFALAVRDRKRRARHPAGSAFTVVLY